MFFVLFLQLDICVIEIVGCNFDYFCRWNKRRHVCWLALLHNSGDTLEVMTAKEVATTMPRSKVIASQAYVAVKYVYD